MFRANTIPEGLILYMKGMRTWQSESFIFVSPNGLGVGLSARIAPRFYPMYVIVIVMPE